MFDVYLCLTTRHDWRLVVVALGACALASCLAFVLYARAPSYPRRRAAGWICAASLVAGSGVWTTHFLSMLAFRTGLPEGYAAWATLGSFVAVVAAAAMGFILAALPGQGARRIAQRLAGGVVIGLGVGVMHYLGMSGYRTAGSLTRRPELVAASLVIGVTFCAAALYTAWPGASARRQLGAAILFMAGVGGLHFTGMAAVRILPDASLAPPPALMSQTAMAVMAVAVMMLILLVSAGAVVLDVAGRNRDLRRLSDALNAMPDGLAFFDAEDRLQAWNTRYADLRQGLPLFRGQTYAEILTQGLDAGRFLEMGVDREGWIAERLAVRRRGEGSIDVCTADGRWLRCSDRPTADGGRITVFADITDLKRAKQAMIRGHDLERQASRIKSEFLANMSHEIRTPMNGIIGMNSLLMMTGLTPSQRRYAEVVQDSADSLMAIFDNILDIARLEAGGVEMVTDVFSLEDLLGEVEANWRPEVRRKGLELRVDADGPPGRPALLGDPGRLRNVLNHLVGNAVKFTDRGQVKVEVVRQPADGGRTAVRIAVSDTGIGVSPQAREGLFEPFRQADGSLTRRHGGTGLGLAICHHAVRLMGGAIGMHDGPGGGSVFWVELTFQNAPAEGEAQAVA